MISGWSMGAQQTYEWAVRFPDMMGAIVPFAGCARTPDHNQIFGDLFIAILQSDPTWNGGFYAGPGAMHAGLRAKARAFALMVMTPAVWRTEAWRSLGFVSAEDFKRGFLEAHFLPMDPNNLICQATKWRAADAGAHAGAISPRLWPGSRPGLSSAPSRTTRFFRRRTLRLKPNSSPASR